MFVPRIRMGTLLIPPKMYGLTTNGGAYCNFKIFMVVYVCVRWSVESKRQHMSQVNRVTRTRRFIQLIRTYLEWNVHNFHILNIYSYEYTCHRRRRRRRRRHFHQTERAHKSIKCRLWKRVPIRRSAVCAGVELMQLIIKWSATHSQTEGRKREEEKSERKKSNCN